jgi:hypothetical protein
MKYIKSKESFLEFAKNKNLELKINEAFQNEITFGGSLIGRLINSSLRKLSIKKSASKIDAIAKELKEYLDQLLEDSFSEEDVFEAQRFFIYYILTLIYRAVMSNSPIVIRLQVLLTQSQFARSGTGPINNSVNNKIDFIEKIFEAENIEESDELKDQGGLIELALSELTDSILEDKDELIRKLTDFKDELLKIRFTKDKDDNSDPDDFMSELTAPESNKNKSKDSDEEDEKKDGEKEVSTETKTKFQFYNETKNFISAYLSILSNIKNSTVKIDTEKKVGDIVAWKQVKGEDAGLVQFAQVTKVQPSSVSVRKLVYGVPKGPEFQLELKHLKSLTYFDDNNYKKLREDTVDQIKAKAAQARLAKYTYQNLKKSELDKHYTEEVERLNAVLKSKTEKKEERSSGTNWNMFDKLFESEVIIPKIDYASIDTWSEIVDVFKKMKESNEQLFKNHVKYLQDLLQNKVDGKNNPTQAKSDIVEIGRLALKRIKAKDSKMLERQMSPSEKKVYDAATIISQIALAILKLKGKDIAALKNDTKGGVGNFVEKYLKSFDAMVEAWKKGAVKIMETSFVTRYDQFRLVLEEDERADLLASARADAAERDSETEDTEKEETVTDQGDEKDKKREKDEIRIAWFKFFKAGEEKKWAYDPDDVAKYQTRIEKAPVNVNVSRSRSADISNESILVTEKKTPADPKTDPILKIIDLFGRAYNLYATEYIPSGRPGGRVSQKTLREYEFIGRGKDESRADASREGDYYTPGKGPWANIKVFEKWRSLVNDILKDPVYRTVLANVNFVSKAEKIKSTAGNDTTQEYGRVASGTSDYNTVSKGSGISLMEFMNKMLSLQGTFRDAANALTRKYFNIEWIDKGDNKSYPGREQGSDKDATDEDKKPYFTTNGADNIKKDAFYVFNVKYTFNNTTYNKYWIAWIFQTGVGRNADKFIFRVQESENPTDVKESVITKWFTTADMNLVRQGALPTTPQVNHEDNRDVFLIVMKSQDRSRIDNGTLSNIAAKRISLVNGDWQVNVPQDLQLTSIRTKNILCTNEKAGKRFKDAPVLRQWSSSKRANKDKEITSANLAALNSITIT